MSGLATGPFDTEYAAAARLLADRLQSLAAPGPDGAPVWSGDDVDPLRSTDQRVVLTHGRLDDGLLTGRTGIATALALCARLPGGRPEWSDLAERAVRSAVRSALAATPTPGGLGWSSGWLGTARAAGLVGRWTDDDALIEDGRRLAGRTVRTLAETPEECPDYPDLLDGWAGHLAAVLAADLDPTLEPTRHTAAAALLERLCAYVDDDPTISGGPVSWPMAGSGPAVIGLAHGGSGISVALAGARAAGLLAGDPLEDLIARTRQWEDGYFRPEAGGWPDLRSDADVPGLAWCHGAPGVGIAAAYRTLAGAPAGAELTFTRASRMVLAYGPPTGSIPFDGTLCHGLTGLVELHLLGAEAWPAAGREHLANARTLARHLTRAGRSGPGWVCGVRDGRTPNVLTGLAGVACTLARCHDPALAPSLAHPGLPALVPATA
ncbi:MAG TPA: lanthionine synthetase LanC family protein [Microlunatus sp.]